MTILRTNLDNTRERAKQLRFEPVGGIAATNVQDAVEEAALISLVSPTVGDLLIGTTSTTPKIVFYGDSLTAGLFGTYPPDHYITMPTFDGLAITKVTQGIPGYTSLQLKDDIYFRVNPNFSSKSGCNIAVVWCGTNDLMGGASAGQTANRIEQVCRHLQLLGWWVIVVTLQSNGYAELARIACNDIVRKAWPRFADEIADIGSDANLGASGAYSNGTYFNADTIHFTDAGDAVAGPIEQAAIERLVGSYRKNFASKVILADNGGATTTLGTKSGIQFIKQSITADDGNEVVWSGSDTAKGRFAAIGSSYTGVDNVYDYVGQWYVAVKPNTGATTLTKRLEVLEDGTVRMSKYGVGALTSDASGNLSSAGWTAYTPTVTAQGGAITSYTVNEAKYMQIGKLVIVFFNITITNAGTGAGAGQLTTPVAPSATYAGSASGREAAVVGYGLAGMVGNGIGIYLTRADTNGNPVVTNHQWIGTATAMAA